MQRDLLVKIHSYMKMTLQVDEGRKHECLLLLDGALSMSGSHGAF